MKFLSKVKVIAMAITCLSFGILGCSGDSDSSESEQIETGGSGASVTSVTLDKTTANLILGNDSLKTTTLTATVNGNNLSDSDKTVTWTSSDSTIATVDNGVVTAVKVGSATITATSTKDTTKKATCSVTVTGTPTYELIVTPGESVKTYGWADRANSGSGMKYPDTTNIIVIDDTKYSSATAKREAFTNAIASGSVSSSAVNDTAAIIVVSGTVDLSDGAISDTDHSYYDSFNTDGSRAHEDIVYQIGSNKAIIGVNGAKVAYGGLQIYANKKVVENIIIRNIDFWDAHGSTEINTSVNSKSKASADNLVLEANGSSTDSNGYVTYTAVPTNIWIDHCKFSDGKCDDLERNYNHDGSLDIKAGKNVTISYCEFTNHDKVTLIAPNDNYVNAEQRQITFHHNYYHGATQRMPRSRGCQVHIYNNVYDNIGTSKNAGYSLGPGTGSMFVVENNYFGSFYNAKSMVQYADATTDDSSQYCSKLYQSGNNKDISSSNIKWDSAEQLKDASKHLTLTKPWTPAYDYSNMQTNADAYTTVPSAAGTDKAGYCSTVQVNGVGY